MAAKMDRLSRSLLNFASLMEELSRAGLGSSSPSTEPRTPPLPQGKMMAGVLATFAQYGAGTSSGSGSGRHAPGPAKERGKADGTASARPPRGP